MISKGARQVVRVLETEPIEVLGLLPYSSNYTFLARVGKGDSLLAVYKPARGERPLWDFPHGSLGSREVAAFEISEAAGWGIVPPTALRGPDAPLGPGSLQLFVEHDPDRHYFVLAEERPADFAVFAAFDAVINNADRKGGHVIEDGDGRLWGVDHGLSFHADPKLRTVIWSHGGTPIVPELVRDLEALSRRLFDDSGLGGRVAGLLSAVEAEATRRRVMDLLRTGSFPTPGDDRPLPWPLI